MASYRSTKLKVTIGYTLLLAILLFSLVFVHREMETLSAADDQENLRTDSLLTLLHEKDRNTIQMLRVLSEANDSLLSASEIEEIISEQDSVITQQRVQHRVITKRDSLLTTPKKKGFLRDWQKCLSQLNKTVPCLLIPPWRLLRILFWNRPLLKIPFSKRFVWLQRKNGCSGEKQSGGLVQNISV